ncbi:MAG: serine/threonine-protein kinase, partial [Gemmatimonadales bacterium]
MTDLRTLLQTGLVGHYTLERELGRGGMATVFLATDLKHERPVAFKVLHGELAQTLGPDRFQREIKLAARLQHPHILTVYDSGETAGQLWFTMPFVDGETLRDRLRRERQLSLPDALRITRQSAEALQYAHEHGVIHRDIKPENLLLTKDGNTLVADFGVARALGAVDDHLTQTGMSVGTPAYMSPEQAAGDSELDARTDIYSLASVLYEMLAGEQPYIGPTMQSILMKRLTDPVPSVRRLRPNVPEAVDETIRMALSPVPADRQATAAEFGKALDVEAGQTSGATAIVRPAPRPRRGLRPALAGTALIVAALIAWWRLRPAPAPAVTIDHLAVLPFTVHGGKSLDFLAQGLVDLLSRNLDGMSDIRSVNGATVLAASHARDSGVTDV